jgi:hypothetical protein
MGCCLPPSFIHVFDLLRRLVRLASLVELKFQRLQSRFRNKVRMGRNRAVGQQVSDAVSALSSLVKATLKPGSF